jgi:hypothetical protein
VTITPAKLTIKSFKLDDVSVSEAEGLGTSDLEKMIKESIVFKDSKLSDVELSDEDFDIEVALLPKGMDKKGTRSISYKVTLNNSNYTFGTKTTKPAKASLRIEND